MGENEVLSRESRALGERNVVALVLDKEKCALISSALDDCKIAACRDEDKNPIKNRKHDEIPEGAICRIKCRSVKSQRCKCCAQGFEIGKDCPTDDDEDNCNLQEDNRALYEGPGAELFPAMTWRDCYEECMDRGMDCHASSYVRLRFNSMCWIFNEVTTRYAEDVEEEAEEYEDPFGSAFGMGFDTRSFMKPKKAKKKSKQIEQRPLLDIPDVMLPASHAANHHPAAPVSMNPNMLGDLMVDGRSLGFRNPHKAGGITIAKGDARAPGNGDEDDEEPEMMSWHRRCQT
jgi:hypothetical protein